MPPDWISLWHQWWPEAATALAAALIVEIARRVGGVRWLWHRLNAAMEPKTGVVRPAKKPPEPLHWEPPAEAPKPAVVSSSREEADRRLLEMFQRYTYRHTLPEAWHGRTRERQAQEAASRQLTLSSYVPSYLDGGLFYGRPTRREQDIALLQTLVRPGGPLFLPHPLPPDDGDDHSEG